MRLEYLWKDRMYGDVQGRPEKKNVLLPGKRGKLLCTYYTAGGEAVCPTVVICHGYPGNEQNLDVAHALRRVGFHVMTFHYSGSWGSEGNFSLANCIEDTECVINLLLSDASLRVDKERLFLFGQSMGGFIALRMLAERNDLAGGVLAMPYDFGRMAELSINDERLKADMKAMLSSGVDWLKGTSADDLYKESFNYCNFERLAEHLLDVPVLAIGGTLDTVAPPAVMIAPLAGKIRELGGKRFHYQEIPTDHVFGDARCTVTELTADYLVKLCENN